MTSESSGRDERALALQRTRTEAARCTACPLWEIGTQTVFGDGPPDAKLMFIGEAPGQQEDKSGVPFVGPAGKLFNEILDAVHIDRSTVYVTNAVKHRPWVESGGRKKNRAPKQSEINACAPWLDLEIELIQPQIVCCLGAVAAKRILGRDFKLTQQRGQWFESELVPHVFATIHPSFILIQPRDTSERWLEVLTSDLRTVKERLLSLSA